MHPLYQDLASVRRHLEQRLPDFPILRCEDTTHVTGEVTGLQKVSGYYCPPSGSYRARHAWNYDPVRGLYIDLTQDQFGETSAPIVIVPAGTPLLVPVDKLTRAIQKKQVPRHLRRIVEELGQRMPRAA